MVINSRQEQMTKNKGSVSLLMDYKPSRII